MSKCVGFQWQSDLRGGTLFLISLKKEFLLSGGGS